LRTEANVRVAGQSQFLSLVLRVYHSLGEISAICNRRCHRADLIFAVDVASMRLLHISGDAWSDDPLDITLCDFLGTDIPPYMILSHRWREDEVLFGDMMESDRRTARTKKGYDKLEMSCRIALQQKLEYAWMDTCCIDKSSSAELSEAINSMYNYYANAQVCYAYLDDVVEISTPNNKSLEECVWFKRGWTLQEMIAPRELYFYSAQWRPLGSKSSLCARISKASGVSTAVLRDPETLGQVCVSEKMSWAASRSTTRPEDEAYCLMGLFGVQMPPLYGEGRQHAFRRLQLEIMQVTTDHTIFAWDADSTTGDMLAPTVQCFQHGTSYQYVRADQRFQELKPDFNMTNFGLHIELQVRKPSTYGVSIYLARLQCSTKFGGWDVGVFLKDNGFGGTRYFHRTVFQGSTLTRLPRKYVDAVAEYHPMPLWISRGDSQPFLHTLELPPLNLEDMQYTFYSQFGRRLPQTQWYSESEISPDHHRSPLKIKGRFDAVVRHEVVAVERTHAINCAFGISDNQIWMHLANANEVTDTVDNNYPSLFDSYLFPAGRSWHGTAEKVPTFVPRKSSSHSLNLKVGGIDYYFSLSIASSIKFLEFQLYHNKDRWVSADSR
jgi:hypothetical protein